MPIYRLLPWTIVFLSLASLHVSHSVAAEIRGMVHDDENGVELIGVDVVLIGTGLRTQTDVDGRFEFAELADGTYELRLTYLGYNSKVLGNILLQNNKAVDIQVAMESFAAHDGGELVVQSNRIMSTESALLAARKQSLVIGDGISAAQISQSPDGTSGEALTRVTGLTVTDGKFVIVRGMPDRYNATTLDDIPITGTDVRRDRKSFSFDMIPSNLLANLKVLKSVTPEMPGEVTGGMVQVNTIEFPEKSTTSIGFSAAHTQGTTGENFQEDATTGSTDWLGKDDGGREKPEVDGLNNLARALPNRWSQTGRKAPPKLSFSLAHGNKATLFGKEIGYLGAISYRDKYDSTFISEHRQGFEDILGEGPRSNRNVLWGGLANVFVRLNEDHRIGLVNTYTRSADSTVESQKGYDSDTDFAWTNISWQERVQFSSRLTGKHVFDQIVDGLDMDWALYYGESSADEPDNRYVSYNSPDETPVMAFNRRSWSDLGEFRHGGSADLSYSFAEFDFEEEYSVKLKSGFLTEDRKRTYDMDNYYADTSFNPTSRALRLLPVEEIFDPGNYNEEDDDRRGEGFNFKQEGHFSGDYTATHTLQSQYLMVAVPFSLFGESIQSVGGFRREDSNQTVLSLPLANNTYADSSMISKVDILPSLNVTWIYDTHVNLRLAYYKSVNRPEFREMAPVIRRNYSSYQNEIGNSNLTRALINNYDLRMEYFPSSGEVITGSMFYKDLKDPIEEFLVPTAEGPLLSWTNSPEGENYGFEVEVRKKLNRVSLLRHIAISVNYTRVWSEVKYFDNYTGKDSVRPLQGQAPWVFNGGLSYDNTNIGLSTNLLFSRIGRRLSKVGNGSSTDIYLEPQNKLDLVITKKIGARYKLKLIGKNILGTNEEYTSGGEDVYLYSSIDEGRELGISLSGKF